MQKKPRGFGLLPSCVYCPWHKASCQEQDSAAKTLYSLAGHAHTKQRHLTTKLSTLLCWFCPSPGSMPRPGSSAIPEGPGGELWYHSPEEHRAISAAELSIVVCSGVRACPVIRSWTSSGEAAWERLEGMVRNGRVFIITQCGFPRAVLQAAEGGILLQPLRSESFGCSGLQPYIDLHLSYSARQLQGSTT